jgi:PPK2 family polyphosphate:nucleotide phosphotransferase
MTHERVTKKLIVEPGTAAELARRDPADRLGLADKTEAARVVEELLAELARLHDRFWAEARRSVLLVLQGMDTSGKDGAIRHVLSGLNPQGMRVASFKAPTAIELAHDYLWRIHATLPERGEIGVFNRSHYEDIVTVRVRKLAPKPVWSRRYAHIREFERLLTDEGTAVVKVFLHISSEEQRKRLQARLDDPDKRWKFRLDDLEARKLWDDFMAAYDEALAKTSTKWAPWYVVPADHKWVRDVAVAQLLVQTLKHLDPRFPEPAEDLAGVVVQ